MLMVAAARMCVPVRWNSATVSTMRKWVGRIQTMCDMEELIHVSQDNKTRIINFVRRGYVGWHSMSLPTSMPYWTFRQSNTKQPGELPKKGWIMWPHLPTFSLPLTFIPPPSPCWAPPPHLLVVFFLLLYFLYLTSFLLLFLSLLRSFPLCLLK